MVTSLDAPAPHVHQQPWVWDFPSIFPLSTPKLVHFWIVAEPSAALFPALTPTRFSSQEKNTLEPFTLLWRGLAAAPVGDFPFAGGSLLSLLLPQHPAFPSTGVSHPSGMNPHGCQAQLGCELGNTAVPWCCSLPALHTLLPTRAFLSQPCPSRKRHHCHPSPTQPLPWDSLIACVHYTKNNPDELI